MSTPVKHHTPATTTAPVPQMIRRTVTADISMTEDQWRAFLHELNIRHVFCSTGIDSAQITDFVLFQVFKGLLEQAGDPTQKQPKTVTKSLE